jgi:hypothetical protein
METITCSRCAESSRTKPTAGGMARLPIGWKRHQDQAWCAACWNQAFVLRTLSFPVVGPVGSTWTEFGCALTASWEQVTQLANWTITELAKADVTVLSSEDRFPKMPATYLYPQARLRFPQLPAKSIAAVLHTVEQRYRNVRFAVLKLGTASLPRFRYPLPFPVNNQGWRAWFGEGDVPLIKLRLLDQTYVLRLRGGPHFRRQLQGFRRLVDGSGLPSQLTLSRQFANLGDHRSGVTERAPGGGRRTQFRIMAVLAVWLPKPESRSQRAGCLEVKTAADRFLVATTAGRKEWYVNADHVRRWIAQHRKRLQRLAEENTFELRQDRRQVLMLTERRQQLTARHARRIETFCHQVTAQIAAYAARLSVAEVRLDTQERSYLADFPWFRFQELLRHKLSPLGIELGGNQDAKEEAVERKAA